MNFDSLAKGDLVGISRKNGSSEAVHHLAMNLMGAGYMTDSLDSLQKEHPEWDFWVAASHWIQGNEDFSANLLRNQNSPQARQLLAHIESEHIDVVGQLSRSSNALTDPKFRLHPVGIQRFVTNPDGATVGMNMEQHEKPFDSLIESIPKGIKPAFYFAQMLEWQFLPKDLPNAPFPVFGAISDYDVHIQNVHPFLNGFDALVTVGSEEHKGISPLTHTPVWTFPKLFHLPGGMQELQLPQGSNRPHSLFISGTLDNPYHPDKTQIISDVINSKLPDVHYVNGFLEGSDYINELFKSKLALSYVRFGGINTRGLEALAAGCAVLAQEKSAMPTFFDQDHGMWTYDPDKDNVPELLQKMLDQWPTLEKAAKLGAQRVRDEFEREKTTSQLLRFLTVLSTLPRRQKHIDHFHQKRLVSHRGPTYTAPISLKQIGVNLSRWEDEMGSEPLKPYINGGREIDLFLSRDIIDLRKNANIFGAEKIDELEQTLYPLAKNWYTEGIIKNPKNLALFFNHLRHSFHLGHRNQVETALQDAIKAADSSPEEWELSSLDDVMPWDYYSAFFNYRGYFDHITDTLSGKKTDTYQAHRLILAAINHYVGLYSGDPKYLRRSVELDPKFPYYQLHLAQTLVNVETSPAELEECLSLVRKLLGNSLICQKLVPILFELESRLNRPLPETNHIQLTLQRIENVTEKMRFGSSEFDELNLTLPPDINFLPINQPQGASTAKDLPWPRGKGEHTELASLHCGINSPYNEKKILLLPFEMPVWEHARQWAYTGHLAFEEGLIANGAKCDLIPTFGGLTSDHPANWLTYVPELYKDQHHDQVWVWLPHVEYGPDFFPWLKSHCETRVAVVSESLQHTKTEENTYGKLKDRQELVLNLLKNFTHVLLFDDADLELVQSRLPDIKTFWCPGIVPWRSVASESEIPDTKPVFLGTRYSDERKALIDLMEQTGLAHSPTLPEDQSVFPEQFDSLHEIVLNCLRAQPPSETIGQDLENLKISYLAAFRRVRKALYSKWMEALESSTASINLPSIFKAYAGRVPESMAAGRPVVSWKPQSKRSQALFTPGEEILWFERDQPEQLIHKLEWLKNNPKQAKEIAERAKEKILKYHTAEVRMRQALDWINFGTEPDYGENTILNNTEKNPNNIMSEQTATLPAELDTLLREADACNDRGDSNGTINALEQALALTNRHPVILRALGTQLFLSKRYTWARTIFEEFTAACPEDATGHVQYAIVAFHEGDADGCAASLQKALVLDPEDTDALKLTADLDVREGSYQEARNKYEKIAEVRGITVEALHALAFCQFQTGDTKRAKDTYKQLLEFNDQDDLARDNLESLTNNPDLKPATQSDNIEPSPAPDEDHGSEILEQADFFMQAGNTHAACAELEKAVLKDPKNPRLVESLGSIQFGIEAYEKARLQFRSLIELEPRNPMAYTRLAMACYQLKRISEFESALGLAMEIDLELPELLNFLGKVNLEAENYHDAGRCFSKLVELDPANTQNILALGACLYQGREYETAGLAFERVLEIDPENSTALKNLDKIRENKNETENPKSEKTQLSTNELSSKEVIEVFEKALSENDGNKAVNIIQNALTNNPDDPELLNVMGNLHLSQDNLTQAAECFHLKANAEEGDVESQLQAAMVYLADGNADQFEVYMEKALHLDPANPTGLKLLATANFKSENYQEAARLFIQAAAVFPEDVEMLLAMGVCFHHLKDRETAAACFKQALEVDPYNQIASENLLVLENEQSVQPDPPIEDNLAPAIKAGSIKDAQKLLSKEQHLEAWNASVEAINQRPFHPDAYLLLAEIALSAGDEVKAKSCLEDLIQLTPKWPIAIETLDSLRAQSDLKTSGIEWPELPPINQNRLSICMIVKDEEQFIGRCLESVKSVANQIVVVDTGSTDQTEAIAKSHGAEVHHFEWCDDFAAARNFALEHVRGDWILVLDADEVLTQKGREGIHQDMKTQNVLGHRIRCEHLEPNESGGYKLMADAWHYIPRLVRNAPGLHFTGIIHEEIFSSAVVRMEDWGMEISFGQTQIDHYGYAPNIKKDRNKIERNITLLERALKDQPDSPNLLISYALDLYNQGDIEAALDKKREAFNLLAKHPSKVVSPEVRERLISVFCNLLLQSELYDEAIEVGESQLAKDCGPTASILYMYALALVKTGKIEEAIKALRECLSKEHEGSYCAQFFGGAHGGFTTVHNLLADCLAKTDRHDEALSEYKLAVEAEPGNTSIRYGYARFLSNIGQPEEAIQALHESIKNGSIDCSLWSLGSQIVNAQMSDSEIAMHWTQCAVEECCNHPEAQKQRGVALLTVGRFEEALSYFEKAPQNTVTAAAKILCQLILNKATTSVDTDKETDISTAFINWYRRLLEYGNESAVKSINDKASSLKNILPTANQILIEALLEK